MSRKFAKPTKRQRKNRSGNRVDYQNLEARQLLATMTGFSGGQLDVMMDAAGDSANISVNAAGEVTVNGSRDMNTNTGAVDAVLASSVTVLNIAGAENVANQSANLGGDFSQANANLVDVSVTNVSSAIVSGDYGMTGDFTVVMEGIGGSVNDTAGSSLVVGGQTMLTARNNAIVLDGDVDLQGAVSLSTLGGNGVTIVDNNDIELASVLVSGDLNLNADDVTDIDGSVIEVDGTGVLIADSVTLGDNPSDVVNFGRAAFNVTGQVELHEDSNMLLGNTNVGSLVASTVGGVFDGRETIITINGNANFDADFGVRLGEHGLDTFNAGSLTINSGGHVHVFEDSGTFFVGDTSARTMDITSLGDVGNADGATITTSFATGFEGDNVDLGNAVGDAISLGGVYFWSLGDVNITEDADLFIIDEKNRADRMALRSTGNIADADNARMTVDRLSFFEADNVTVGDSLDDSFNSGSVNFNVAEQFFIRENSGLNIAGNNMAEGANVGAAGDLTSADETTINVDTVTRFLGANIDVGNQTTDNMNFGSLVVMTDGTAIVSEDSSTLLAGESTADLLVIRSVDMITNGAESSINVARTANFQAVNGINIGNATDDDFNAQAITANSPGANVLLSEDSSMFMVGTSNANAMVLNTTGTLGNGDNAVIDVDTRLTLDAVGLISLGTKVEDGTGALDRIESGSLVINTPANATVESESDVLFVESSSANNMTILARDGAVDKNIEDQPDASIVITESLFLTGMDIIIGELGTDCLDVGVDINFTASGTDNIQEGCP